MKVSVTSLWSGRRVTEQPADDGKAERCAGAEAREAMAQIVDSQPVQPGGARRRGPGLFQIRSRFAVLHSGGNDERVAGEARRCEESTV